jgi:hypothetical protein
MRLTVALVKDLFERAIESQRVKKLKEAFHKHLGLENRFARSVKTKGCNKVSLYGYECRRFAEQDETGVSKIETVVREVWPDGARIVQGPSAGSRAGLRDGDLIMMEAYCAPWRLFNTGMRHCCGRRAGARIQPERTSLSIGDLGGRWCMLLPSNRCSTFYLHTLVYHGGDLMEHCLQRNVTTGMLEN